MVRKAETSDIECMAIIYRQLHKNHVAIRSDYFNMPNLSFSRAVLRKLCQKAKRN